MIFRGCHSTLVYSVYTKVHYEIVEPVIKLYTKYFPTISVRYDLVYEYIR